jgi:hypothetical protein
MSYCSHPLPEVRGALFGLYNKGTKMNLMKSNAMFVKGVLFTMSLMISQSFSAIITVNPSSSEVFVGNQFNVDLLVSDLGIDEDISLFDFDLFYDPSIIQFSKYNLSDKLGSISSGDALDVGGLVAPGQLNLSSVSFLTELGLQPDAFKLATVTFKGLAEGFSSLSIGGEKIVGNAVGDPLSFTNQNGGVNSVPESSTVMLFGFGLISLVAAATFRKKTVVE